MKYLTSLNWKKYVPVVLLFLVEAVLFYLNFTSGTYLMGWDNVMPEFNFWLNLKRSIFSVWQEYRGLGLYDGMSHAANLLHTIYIWMLSLVLPQNTLRYVFHFSMHVVGMIGMFFLIHKIFFERGESRVEKFSTSPDSIGSSSNNKNAIAILGALFYGFNLITIQMFYTPLEAFSTHFASLPWLVLSFMNFLEKGTRKSLLFFAIILLVFIPQYFVTTLYL
jgi:hypothetical protein